MGTRTDLLPALGMPKHTFFCPKPLLLPGICYAVMMAFILSLFFGGLELIIMVNYGLWHAYWAARFQQDPWVYDGIITRYRVGVLNILGIRSTKGLFKEKGWTWYA